MWALAVCPSTLSAPPVDTMALRSRCGVRGQCRGQRELPLRPPHPHSVQTALPALQLPVSCSAQLSEHESRVSRVRVVCQAASVDPLTQQQGEYQPGKTFIIHSNDDLAKFTQGDKTKAKLTVSRHDPTPQSASTRAAHPSRLPLSEPVPFLVRL